MGAFHYDNPLIRAMIRIANMMLASFFWLICCLPVVTVIPSCAALYHTTAKAIRGDGNGVTGCFFKAFKDSLKKGVPLTLIAAASGAFLAYTVWFGFQLQKRSTMGTVYFLIGCTLSLIWLAAASFLPPALSRFEGGVGMYLRMAAYFASKSLPMTVVRLVLLGVVAALADFYPVALLILPGLYTDLICGGVEKLMRAFIEESGLAEHSDETESAPEEEARPAELSSLELDELYGDKGDEE